MQMQLLIKKITKRTLIKVVAILSILLLPILILLGFYLQFNGRIYPNVHLAGVNVGGMTPVEARTALTNSFTLPESITLVTTTPNSETHMIPTRTIGAQLDTVNTVNLAYT